MNEEGLKIIKNYKILELVGQGEFSKVFKSINLDTNIIYAVKIFSKYFNNQENTVMLNLIKNERNIIKKFNHINIVKIIEYFESPNNLYIVYEFCEIGTLDDVLMKKFKYNTIEYFEAFSQIIEGFKPILNVNIIHRDIKPSNFLVKENLIKISDFGFSTEINSNEVKNDMLGSPIYMSPEILEKKYYDKRSDIYSLGITFYELIYGKPPFVENSIPELINSIKTKRDKLFPANIKINKDIKNLISSMIKEDKNERINWEQLFENFGKIYQSYFKNKFIIELNFIKIIKIKNISEKLYDIIISKQNNYNKIALKIKIYMNALFYSFNNFYDIDEDSHSIILLLLIEKINENTENLNYDFDKLKKFYVNCIQNIPKNIMFYKEIKDLINNKKIHNIDKILKFYIKNYSYYLIDNWLQKVVLNENNLIKLFIHINQWLDIYNLDKFILFYIKDGWDLKKEKYYKLISQLDSEDFLVYLNQKLNYIFKNN